MRLTSGGGAEIFVSIFMPASRPLTQKQMAAALGVSQALVSRALTGRAAQIGASPRTVARIKRLAEQRGYQPHPAALALRGAPTRVLGVVVKDFEDPYFGRLIRSLQSAARERGVSLLLTGHGPDDVAALQRNRVDGVILAGSDFRPRGLRRVLGEGSPLVQLGTGPAHPGACLVGMDEAAGLDLLVAHLRRLGHCCIGFAGRSSADHRRRMGVVRAAAAKHGVRFSQFVEDQAEELVGKVAAQVSSRSKRGPTAFVAGDDLLALALVAGLAARGILVPRDLSLVGIDDIPAAASAWPPLTTLAQPMPQMAAAALEVLSQPRDRAMPSSRLFPGQLVVRKSCAAPTD